MTTAIIIIFVNFIFVAALYISSMASAKVNGNILLGVTLPYDALKDENVANIIKRYRKAYSLIALIFLALIVSIIFFANYITIMLMYMLIFIITCLYANQKNVAKYFDELYTLKRKRNWWAGNKNIINIDTEVSRLKNTFPVSKKWFSIPLIISVSAFVFGLSGYNGEMVFWLVPLCGAFTLLILFFIYLAYDRDRTIAYSDDSEVNIALNRIYKREWTKCIVILACLNSFIFALITYLFSFVEGEAVSYAIIAICVLSTSLIIPIFRSYNKVRDTRNKLLTVMNEEVYSDDDEYWFFGAMFYNNPNDSRSMVEKRIGYGMTVNMAKRSGKLIYVVMISAVVFLVWLCIYLTPLDFGSISFNITEETATVFLAPRYEYSFSTDDIKSVTLVDDLPSMKKINGVNSPRTHVGRFSISGYGVSHVYIHLNNPPYIIIELENDQVFLNGATSEQTEMYFNKLNNGGIQK